MNSRTDNENEFSDLFEFDSPEQELASNARALNFRFLSEIEKHSDSSKGFKKRLANLIDVSASYITQLFNGEKLLNLETAAKFEKALKIKFRVVAYPEDIFYKSCQSDTVAINVFTDIVPSGNSFILQNARVQVMQNPVAPELS